MKSIIDLLSEQQTWEEFLTYRLLKGRFTWYEFDEADTFVSEEQYLDVVRRLQGGGRLSVPTRHLVNKMGSGKKRVVYSFPPQEMIVMKAMAYLLYRYDSQLASNCYSFRRGLTAHDAVRDIVRAIGDRPMWGYKLDIHDYFNSISIPLLLPVLSEVLADDPPLYRFFSELLTDGRALYGGETISEEHGVMAGTPTSPFLADVYLMDVDRHFADAGVVYARYSDDIILFAQDKEELDKHKATLLAFLKEYRLEVNPEKEHLYSPDEPFEFLGFRCHGNTIDISGAVRTKMKGKIRRAARSLQRWRAAKGVSAEQAMKALIRKLNAKFFEGDDPDSLSWSRWFFPVINRTEGLKEIDLYLQQYIRYLSTGRHTKTNYRVRYDDLKALGYRSLVHEFYLYKSK